MRYFELQQGRWWKFWAIERRGHTLYLNSGSRPGEDGRHSVKAYSDESRAEVEMARQIERKLRDGYVELMTLRRLAHPDGRVRELQRRGAEIHEYHGTSAGMRPGTSHGANLADSQSEDEEGKRMAQEIVSRWLQQGFKEQDNPVDRFSEVDLELFGLGRPELLEVPQG